MLTQNAFLDGYDTTQLRAIVFYLYYLRHVSSVWTLGSIHISLKSYSVFQSSGDRAETCILLLQDVRAFSVLTQILHSASLVRP
jgi:hypothetical protein